jgi:hypothetical protein
LDFGLLYKKVKQRHGSSWSFSMTLLQPLVDARILLLLTAVALSMAQRQFPIPPLEVSEPNTWGRVIFKKHWIDPNSLKPVACRQPVGRWAATSSTQARVLCASDAASGAIRRIIFAG